MRRKGFTMIELIVSIAVISVLMALLVPAVQVARESARRMTCQSHLKQLGIAIASYESRYGVFPSGSGHKYELLPFIDRRHEFELASGPGTSPSNIESRWDQVRGIGIPLYACPSDPLSQVMVSTGGERIASTNYAACSGTWLRSAGEYDGMFTLVYPTGLLRGSYVRPADVTDGLSNTVAMSEIVHGDLALLAPNALPHLRTIWTTPSLASSLDVFAEACASVPPDAGARGWRGNPWLRGIAWYHGGPGMGMYNHVLGPNRPSCVDIQGAELVGAYTATSFHVGGVHSLFGDGHVTFVASSIDLNLWRRMASRAGNE